ncbi:clamp loader subunit [Salicola phage SCTP-2]|nr:clamp loader subunit [Salicola phage SCTP-2]
MQQLWYQKYRPTKIDDYVFTDEQLKSNVKKWIDEGDFPHLLLSGNPGAGKSSLAQLLIDQCGFEEVDVKKVSGSIYRKIDDFEDDILQFAENQSFGPKGRVVLIDEGDRLSPLYQDALRNVIGGEDYTNCRFIMTCNYPHKIIDALKSRFEHLTFDKLDKDQFMYRVAVILSEENVKTDRETLEEYVNMYYPDLRKTINKVQHNVKDGELQTQAQSSAVDSPDWMKEAIIYFQDGNIRRARETIINNITYEDYDYFYELMYKNLHWFGKDDADKCDAALLAIKNAYVEDHTVANREIVLSACLAKLGKIKNS